MKSFLSLALVAIVAGVAVASGGGENNTGNLEKQVSIELSKEGKVALTVLDDEGGKVNITIFKDSGKKLYQESVSYGKAFTMPIDLSLQDEGTFKFVVQGNDIDFEQQVFHSKLHKEDVFASIEEVSTKVFNVKVLREDTPVRISINDELGREVFSKTYSQSSNFQQKFDLSNVEGELEISISGQKSYIRSTLAGS